MFKLYCADVLSGLKLVLVRISRVADPHHFSPGPEPYFDLNANPVQSFHFIANPDPDHPQRNLGASTTLHGSILSL
jgi:hypothetical protein